MTEFATIARNELVAVEAELALLPLFQKYERLRDLVALYSGESEGHAPAPLSRFARATEPKRINRAANPERDRAMELAAEAIRGRYSPTKTSEIYDIIIQQGALIGGKSPKGNLSAMLYHSPLFRSHGRQGWTLREHDSMVDLLGIGEPEAEHNSEDIEGRDEK